MQAAGGALEHDAKRTALLDAVDFPEPEKADNATAVSASVEVPIMRLLARAIHSGRPPAMGWDDEGCCASPSADCKAKAEPAKGRCGGAGVKRIS